jgi:UDP-N-acetylmuramoyl-tripeptide--D-alanyl-D-alanine ligase
MIPLTLPQVRSAVLGRSEPFAANGKTNRLPDLAVASVSTDTRAMSPGALFIALRGERFDGHDYLADAKTAGAVAAVVDHKPRSAPADLPLIEVPDTRKALGKLANHIRRQLKHTKVIAVAGSNGKTTTKHLIHAALSKHLKGTFSPRSFNNDVGVPLTLLPVSSRDDYVVVECGTSHPGEIAALSLICEPDIAVITNAGPEHLQALKDLAGVRKENASITAGMQNSGCLIVHGDDRELLAATSPFGGKKITFGLEKSNNFWAGEVDAGFDGVHFNLNGTRQQIFVPLLGRHIALCALAAIAVARRLGVPDEAMLDGLAHVEGPAMRMQHIRVGGVHILNDAYNANPASLAAALATLRDLPHLGRKIAVLGDMLELGPMSDQYHRDAGKSAAASNLDVLVCVGPGGSLIAAGAVIAGMSGERVLCFADAPTAADAVSALVRPGDLVLLKASRGIRLEQVAEALVSRTVAV